MPDGGCRAADRGRTSRRRRRSARSDPEPGADLDVYDPATNSWTTLAPLPTGGWASGAALAGQFYVVVRRFNGITPEYRTYAYNRSTNRWKAKAAPDFFGPLTRVTLDGRAHLFMAGGDQSALYTP